jgi:hypothetical protein
MSLQSGLNDNPFCSRIYKKIKVMHDKKQAKYDKAYLRIAAEWSKQIIAKENK